MIVHFLHSIFGIISLTLGITILVSYLLIKGLRRPPGVLLLWQTILQVIVDIEWGVIGFYKVGLERKISSSSCSIIGIFMVYSYFVVWNYILCLICELIIRLKDPMNGNYKKRSPVYHLTAHLCGVASSVYASVKKQSGESIIATCFLRPQSKLLVIIPLCTYYPLAIAGIIYLATLIKTSTSKLTKKYVYLYLCSLVIYTAVWIMISVSILLDDHGSKFNDATEIVGSFSGIIINTLRLCDPALWNYIKSRIKRPIRRDSNRNSSVYESSYIQMMTQVFSVAVLKSIISINLVLSTEQEVEDENILWTREHYELFENYKYDKNDIKTMLLPDSLDYAVQNFKCLSKVYAPMVFDHLRSLSHVTNEEICDSFNLESNLYSLKTNTGNKGGRSASFFYFTFDKKFLIKTISASEKKFLLHYLLSDYHNYLKTNEDSFLARILGIYSFRFDDNSKTRVMLQMNIFPNIDFEGIFDLKGSKLERSSFKSPNEPMEIQSGKIYKDLDFLNTKKKISIEAVDVQRAKTSTYNDSKFLREHNIIDYSMLLGISDEYNSVTRPLIGIGEDKGKYIYVGIIDYLQTYTTFKQLEAFSKNLILVGVPKEDISIISPDIYFDRFFSFITSIITC